MVWESGALAEFVRAPLAPVGEPAAGACRLSLDLGALGLKGIVKREWEEWRQTTKTLGRRARPGGTLASWDWSSGAMNTSLRAGAVG